MSRPTDARPDDAAFRVRVETFALLRRVLPIGVLGVPVHTLAWGHNDFCPDCLEVDPHGASNSESRETRESAPGSTADGADGSADSREGTEGKIRSVTPHTEQHDEDPGTDIVRRVDPHDERTALEIEQAFDGGDSC